MDAPGGFGASTYHLRECGVKSPTVLAGDESLCASAGLGKAALGSRSQTVAVTGLNRSAGARTVVVDATAYFATDGSEEREAATIGGHSQVRRAFLV